ncbi:MAG: peptidoglycan-binding domain-containing protein [Gammaproteobacteria bacterium]
MEVRKRTNLIRAAVVTVVAGALWSGVQAAGEGGDDMLGAGLLPANARAGECYAKVMVPAQYKTIDEKVVVAEATEKIEIIPAKYEWTEVRVPVQQESEKLVVVPATYKKVEEKIEISPAHTVWRLGPGKKAKAVDDRELTAALALGLPATAQAGQCFNQFYRPARFETKEEKLLKTAASEKIETTKPEFEVVEEKVLVKEASFEMVEVPAEYDLVEEKVLASPAYTTWKKGRGLNETVDNATGEIMCLVEVPAKYTTLKKRVLKKAASIKQVEIPAEYKTVKVQKLVKPSAEKRTPIEAEYQTVSRRVKVADAMISWNPAGTAGEGKATGKTYCLSAVPAEYKTITKQVIETPATIKKVTVPATFQNVRMHKLVSKATETRIPVPAKYKIVPKHTKVSAARQDWRPVLCETNTTRDLVLQIQRGLKQAGFDPGTIDGVLGRDTINAADDFQRKNNLPTGGLTIQTLEKLGIKIGDEVKG